MPDALFITRATCIHPAYAMSELLATGGDGNEPDRGGGAMALVVSYGADPRFGRWVTREQGEPLRG